MEQQKSAKIDLHDRLVTVFGFLLVPIGVPIFLQNGIQLVWAFGGHESIFCEIEHGGRYLAVSTNSSGFGIITNVPAFESVATFQLSLIQGCLVAQQVGYKMIVGGVGNIDAVLQRRGSTGCGRIVADRLLAFDMSCAHEGCKKEQ